MQKPEAVQPSAYESSSSLRAERVVEEARRRVLDRLPRYGIVGRYGGNYAAERQDTGEWVRWSDVEQALVLASRETAPSAQWQPIETAPEMRKVVVFYRNALGKGRTVMACYYRANALEMHDDYADVGEFNEAGESFAPAGWYEEHDSDSPLMPLQESPTHWMPLPSPPA